MGKDTAIQWADNTFNAWRGCQKVSPACANCYAEDLSKVNPAVLGKWGPPGVGVRAVAAESYWRQLRKWNAVAAAEKVRQRVFLNSLSDFGEDWTDPIHDTHGNVLRVAPGLGFEGLPVAESASTKDWPLYTLQHVRERLFHAIDCTPWLDYLILTKRPENLLRMIPPRGFGRTFPVMRAAGVSSVPLAFIAEHEGQIRKNHNNLPIDVIHGMGGLTPAAILSAAKGYPLGGGYRPPPATDDRHALAEWEVERVGELRELVRQWQAVRPNVWLGTTVETQEYIGRAEELAKVPAKCRFLSIEPQLDATDLGRVLWAAPPGGTSPMTIPRDVIQWVIVGGESGADARPFAVEWARSLVAQCRAAGVACFVKQMGSRPVEEPGNGPLTFSKPAEYHPDGFGRYFLKLIDDKGGDLNEWPDDLRVRELPKL